ncbi:MAG: hypothetical protein O3C60_01350 [Planctomycetota bacterium]|nr:hypothetical protein [Planctomycetota bacterium]
MKSEAKKKLQRACVLFAAFCIVFSSMRRLKAAEEKTLSVLSIATFDVDATPPVGFMMAYDRAVRVDELGLRCRGIAILGAGEPIVLCAVDWIGIANESQDVFRERIAKAAGTSPSRVAVHTLHQHDAPRCDFSAESLLHQIGASDLGAHDGSFARELINRLVREIESSIAKATPITHAGFGSAFVRDVASNRRIQDETGQVIATRFSTTRDEKLRALPDGIIDPELSSVSFWNGETPVAVLSYYACHPQSYYRTGIPNPDFPGIARFMRSQDAPGPLYIHFNGAGGNVGAGKYNDGSKENRMVLATRVADAMRESFKATQKFEVSSTQVKWETTPVSLPLAKHLDREKLTTELKEWDGVTYWGAPDKLAWLLRCESGHTIDLSCLTVGTVRILHMPGELFVEYQLAAKAMRPDLQVAMAAYGDYGPGYIGTAEAYGQGGYETSERASNVAPETEAVLMSGIRTLLQVDEATK